MKPPDYSAIAAKAKAVRRRSRARTALCIGYIPGGIGVALVFWAYWPTDPAKAPPMLVVVFCVWVVATGCGAIFSLTVMLAEQVWRLIAGNKRPLPTLGDARPPASKSDASTKDIKGS